MKRRPASRPGPPGRQSHGPVPRRRSRHTTVSARSRHTTMRSIAPLGGVKRPGPQRRVATPKPVSRAPQRNTPKSQVGRILDDESSLLDLIDNLLSKGVMLNADLILALADVDLVYVRLSALLCAADRVLPALSQTSPRLRGAGETPAKPPGKW